MKARLQPVEIEWVDAATTDEWSDPEELLKGEQIGHCKSVGYLAKWTSTEVMIVQSMANLKLDADCAPQWCGTMTIPLGQVTELRVLMIDRKRVTKIRVLR